MKKFNIFCLLTGFLMICAVAQATPQMAVEINPNPPAIGEMVDVQILLSNPDNSTTGNLSVELVWPQYLYGNIRGQIGGGSCSGSCSTGEVFLWDTSDLASLASGLRVKSTPMV